MKLIELERRLARIEAGRSSAPPTRILSDAPLGDPAADMRAADALANWRARVAAGQATVSDGVLYLVGPEMTPDEWAPRTSRRIKQPPRYPWLLPMPSSAPPYPILPRLGAEAGIERHALAIGQLTSGRLIEREVRFEHQLAPGRLAHVDPTTGFAGQRRHEHRGLVCRVRRRSTVIRRIGTDP